MKRTDSRTLVYHNTSRLRDGRIKTENKRDVQHGPHQEPGIIYTNVRCSVTSNLILVFGI